MNEKTIDYESLGFRDIVVEGSSFQDVKKNLGDEVRKLSKNLGVSMDREKSFFEVFFYSGKSFDDYDACIFGSAGNNKENDEHFKQNYDNAKKRIIDIIDNNGIISGSEGPYVDTVDEATKDADGRVKVHLCFPQANTLTGIIGQSAKQEENHFNGLFDTSAYNEAYANAFKLNANIKETTFKEHIKASFRYKFEEVNSDENQRSIKEELKAIGIEEKWFNDFFNDKIKKVRKKSNGIIPSEQQTKLISYFQNERIRVLDDKLNVVKKNLASFEARRFSELSGIDFNDLMIENYDLIRADTYGLGVDAVKSDGLIVPFFRQNLQARIRQAVENPDNDLRDVGSWNDWLNSNAGIIYKGGDSGKFKIVHNCLELINIDRDFDDYYLPVSYNDYVVDGVNVFELDTDDSRYDTLLSYNEVINHSGWLALVQNNQNLLEQYAKTVFDYLKEEYNRKKTMRFLINQEPEAGELRALYVYDIDSNSYAVGSGSLSSSADFIRVAHK